MLWSKVEFWLGNHDIWDLFFKNKNALLGTSKNSGPFQNVKFFFKQPEKKKVENRITTYLGIYRHIFQFINNLKKILNANFISFILNFQSME